MPGRRRRQRLFVVANDGERPENPVGAQARADRGSSGSMIQQRAQSLAGGSESRSMSFPPILPQQQHQQHHPGSQAARKQQQHHHHQQQHQQQPPPPPPASLPQEPLSSSWPSATLKRQLARRAPVVTGAMPPPAPSRPRVSSPRAPPPRPLQQHRPLARSCESVLNPAGRRAARASPPQPLGAASSEEPLLRFSLRLTPEAALLIQRRNLEKQMSSRRQGAPSGQPQPGGSKRVFACNRGGRRGAQSPPEGRGPPTPQDLLLKISLLNERHRYDDVEYEEDAGGAAGRPPDEGLVRRCTEWLRGVESAASPDRLQSLPHLSIIQ